MPSLLRLSGPALGLGAVLIIVTVSLGRGIGPAYLLGVALVVLSLVGQFLQTRLQRPTQEQDPVAVAVPVRGRWRGLNSPTSSIPSHTHRLAQTYALDITHEPDGASPRALDPFWAPMRRPEGFPSFGQEVLAQIDVRDAAAEPARRLHQVTGNTLHVAALVGDDILYVDKVEDEAGVRMYSRVGAPARAHCSGVGKVILAGLRGRNRQALLAKVSWEKYTENTITDRHALEAQLEVIAAQGWAADDGEFEDFVNCLAVPITSSAGVVGALSVTAIRMVKNLADRSSG